MPRCRVSFGEDSNSLKMPLSLYQQNKRPIDILITNRPIETLIIDRPTGKQRHWLQTWNGLTDWQTDRQVVIAQRSWNPVPSNRPSSILYPISMSMIVNWNWIQHHVLFVEGTLAQSVYQLLYTNTNNFQLNLAITNPNPRVTKIPL